MYKDLGSSYFQSITRPDLRNDIPVKFIAHQDRDIPRESSKNSSSRKDLFAIALCPPWLWRCELQFSNPPPQTPGRERSPSTQPIFFGDQGDRIEYGMLLMGGLKSFNLNPPPLVHVRDDEQLTPYIRLWTALWLKSACPQRLCYNSQSYFCA